MSYIRVNNEVEAIPYPDFNEDNLKAFYKPDVISENFVLNDGGWPRSDIAIINEQTNLEAAQNLLNKLSEVPADNANAGLTDAEIMLSHRSKYQQTQGETVEWLERQLSIRDSKLEAKKVAESTDNIIKFDEDESK